MKSIRQMFKWTLFITQKYSNQQSEEQTVNFTGWMWINSQHQFQVLNMSWFCLWFSSWLSAAAHPVQMFDSVTGPWILSRIISVLKCDSRRQRCVLSLHWNSETFFKKLREAKSEHVWSEIWTRLIWKLNVSNPNFKLLWSERKLEQKQISRFNVKYIHSFSHDSLPTY